MSNLGPIISQRQLDRVLGYIDADGREGARLLTGGQRLSGDLAGGYFVQPTLFDNVSNDMKIEREEIFGPVISVIAIDTEAEALRLANDSNYGPGGTVSSTDFGSEANFATSEARALARMICQLLRRRSAAALPPVPGRGAALIGNRLPLLAHRRHLPFVECLRGFRTAGPHSDAARGNAGWSTLPVGRSLYRARTRWLCSAQPHLRGGARMRRATCTPPCLCDRAGPHRSRSRDANRRGLQGVRSGELRAEGFSCHRPQPARAREHEKVRALHERPARDRIRHHLACHGPGAAPAAEQLELRTAQRLAVPHAARRLRVGPVVDDEAVTVGHAHRGQRSCIDRRIGGQQAVQMQDVSTDRVHLLV